MICHECGKKMRRVKRDYVYTEAGLDGIILKGIWVYECGCGEIMPEIKNIEGLHKAIAYALVKKSNSLSGKELRFIRKEMGLKAKELASVLGVDPVSVSRWETSSVKISMATDKLVRMLFIQMVEEQCKTVVNAVSLIRAIKPTARRTTIEVPNSSWNDLCGYILA